MLREVLGLNWPPSANGKTTFQLVGDLTVRAQTRPATWQVTALFTPTEVTGRAATEFTFADLGLAKPRVLSVLTVEDTIRLELDFTLLRQQDGPQRDGAVKGLGVKSIPLT